MSEQALAKQILERLPSDGVLMADINFGVFSVAWDAQTSHHAVLFRVQEARARRMCGGILPPANSERRVEWRPSRDELRAHPELPDDAVVRGRLLVAHVEGKDGSGFACTCSPRWRSRGKFWWRCIGGAGTSNWTFGL